MPLTRQPERTLSCVMILFFAWTVACPAGVIVDVNTSPATNALGIGGEFQAVIGTSWTMDQAFTGVNISASVASANPNDIAFADLTTAIGPGTTSSDVIAEATFVLPVILPLRNASNFTIFTNLSLNAGTYYLIITTPFDLSQARGWVATSNTPTVTRAPGVTLNPAVRASGVNADSGFPPGSNFAATNFSFQFNVSTVPEPASLMLFFVGVATAIGFPLCRPWRGARRAGIGDRDRLPGG